jgi:SAM-dependent methyltransferase
MAVKVNPEDGGLKRTRPTWTQRLDAIVQLALAPGAGANLSAQAGTLLDTTPQDGAILDAGCGFASPLARAGFRLVGVDIDVRRARAHARSATVADARALPFANATFAAAFSFGLLHHLDDGGARQAIAEMIRVVRPGGLIAIFDGVVPDAAWRRPIAALIRALDFGRHMRSDAELRALFGGGPAWQYQRVTYAGTGLEGVWCVRGSRGAVSPRSSP